MNYRVLTIEELLGRQLSETERANAPRVLYYAGALEVPLLGPRVAVVGTRRPEFPERAWEVAELLTNWGAIIVSGLARGTDTIAHVATLVEGGRTLAVLGTPLDVYYPPENRNLQSRLMREQGVVTQFPPGSAIVRANFPARNRTMALISDAAVVTEAGERSGTVHLCRECLRLGRPLFLHESLASLSWPPELRGARFFSDAAELIDVMRDESIV